jgi:predicted O-linked N-acetylglucosamine transferase (SPINDLY family)
MNTHLKKEDINKLFESGNYEKIEEVLEKQIEQEQNIIIYYWYLGLAYLLQEKETEAHATWLLVMSEGNEEQVEKWQDDLLEILEAEASRQSELENLHVSWLIRGHIREINPLDINNILKLIILEDALKVYDPSHLENWQLVDYLNDKLVDPIDEELLFQAIPLILETPVLVNLDFLYACCPYIKDVKAFAYLLETVSIKFAYELHLPDYAVDLTQVSLSLMPNDLALINELSIFSTLAQNYEVMAKSADQFLAYANLPELKAWGCYKQLFCRLNSGNWLDVELIAQNYVSSLQMFINSNPNSLEEMNWGGLNVIPSLLLYLRDTPRHTRVIQNKIAQIFQSCLQNSISWRRDKEKCPPNQSEESKVLRIGYIAHTFKRHSVGWLSRWLLHYHNKTEFHVALYLIGQQEDDITIDWFIPKANTVHRCHLIAQDIAIQIEKDGIDILVDLDSFSHGITCQVLGLKPAPIQITWLGFDASGLPAVDYFIADPYVLPNNAQDYYQEKIWRLPTTYLAVDGFEVGVPTLKRENLGIAQDATIYITVQTAEKRHPDTIRLQMQVLQAVPHSYLLIKGRADPKRLERLFKTIAEEYGIGADRLRFLEKTPTEEIHRANLSIADVVLDTYPYNGATTTLEALWMGIPIVTKVGQQFAARNSYTFMINAGITEGIANTDQEYLDWAIRLGTDRQLRQQIFCKLYQSRQTAPVWNAKQFTREMENAYHQMWRSYLET